MAHKNGFGKSKVDFSERLGVPKVEGGGWESETYVGTRKGAKEKMYDVKIDLAEKRK